MRPNRVTGGENTTGPNENNHANQLNENNDAYWESRGYDERPDDWETRDE